MRSDEVRGSLGNQAEKMAETAKDYVGMQIDLVKLRAVEKLTVLSSKLLSVLIITLFGGFALIYLGFALGWYLGDLTGSQSLGFVITAGIFAVLGVIAYAVRKALFTRKLIDVFTDIFFDEDNDGEE